MQLDHKKIAIGNGLNLTKLHSHRAITIVCISFILYIEHLKCARVKFKIPNG